MDTDALIHAISAEDADIAQYARCILDDPCARETVVQHMLTHPDIMVYYHCFYVVDRASRERPDLFFPYWDAIAALLRHPNSYHRDFALTILATLTQVDPSGRFAAVCNAYFEHLHDARFMTGRCCVRNSARVIQYQPALRDPILARLLDVDNGSAYSQSQQALLHCDVLDVIDQVDEEIRNKPEIQAFIKACAGSQSPKTRKRAKAMIGK